MLVSVDDLKEYLGIPDSNITYDDFLEQQEAIISSAIENYCARKFLVDDYKQTIYRDDYNKPHISEIFLYHYPVNSITSIFEGTTEITDYRLDMTTGRLVRTEDNYRRLWFLEDNYMEITFNAGYATTPEEVKAVIFNLIEERYNKKVAGINVNFGNNVQSVSIPGVMNIQYDYTLTSNERSTKFGMILGDWVNVLDHYRTERALTGKIQQYEYVETV